MSTRATLAIVLLAAVLVAAFFVLRKPAQAPLDTAAQLKRGRYLVENVVHCFACHSDVDWAGTGLPKPGMEGGGGRVDDDTFPFPIYAPNISPDPETGAGTWTVEQFRRALRDGIGHDGRKLLIFMPYEFFRQMSDADLDAVIAYIRSIPPVKNKIPPIELPEEVRRAVEGLSDVLPPLRPGATEQVRRGHYLATVAACSGCHTTFNSEKGYIPELTLAGGTLLYGRWGKVASANLTPDPSGIAHYDEAMFLRTIREGAVQGVRPLNNIMLWRWYRGMTDDDLKAIFAYLRTLEPVSHRVDNTEPPAPCETCGNTHGFGERN